jgi:hypothetical protein
MSDSIQAAQQQLARSIADFMKVSGPKPADALIDKLYGGQPLTTQERHDLASILYAVQEAARFNETGAAVRKATHFDRVRARFVEVFGETS